ncbi:MAG: YggT family protein [Gammaproteobacteria bacterium]|nr:YggT family protein [Gammaproteobacteria bacterium]MCK5091662.1 YggT family protein [Gammaproteobacteria bacterium]
MNSYFTEAGVFLINVIFGFYILMVMLRFMLQIVRADFHNPVSQFLVKITSPALKPLRRFIPGVAGIDMSAIVLLLGLKFIEQLLTFLLMGSGIHIGALILISVTGLISLALYIYIIGIFVQVIFSWIQPGASNPIIILLYQLTEPVMRPVRRLLPPISGLDLSPLLAIIVLQLIVMAIPHLQRTMLNLF